MDAKTMSGKAFNARSLVGMTQSARKRLAFWEVYVPYCLASYMCGETPPIAWRRRSMTALAVAMDLRTSYEIARGKYRLNERLRPCPGCAKCKTGPVRWGELQRGRTIIIKADGEFYATLSKSAARPVVQDGDGWVRKGDYFAAATFCRNDLVMIVDTGPYHCDGTGVIPAGKNSQRKAAEKKREIHGMD